LKKLTIRSLWMTTMADVDRLLREYIERFEAGGSADPGDLLSQLEGRERTKLSVLIEGYLEHSAPAQDWDPEAFEGSAAERAVARVAESWSEASGQLPRELVRLRNERQITRADLVSRLADSLGVSDLREKVAFYYHRMERGLLPAEGVSTKVWEALARLLGTSADSLRQAASSVEPGAGATRAVSAYARTAPPPPEEYARDVAADVAAGMASPGEPESREPDEVDVLFTGG
jgi:hypothetical protein